MAIITNEIENPKIATLKIESPFDTNDPKISFIKAYDMLSYSLELSDLANQSNHLTVVKRDERSHEIISLTLLTTDHKFENEFIIETSNLEFNCFVS